MTRYKVHPNTINLYYNPSELNDDRVFLTAQPSIPSKGMSRVSMYYSEETDIPRPSDTEYVEYGFEKFYIYDTFFVPSDQILTEEEYYDLIDPQEETPVPQIFEDAYTFLDAATLLDNDPATPRQLVDIIKSEVGELEEAISQFDTVETLDAIVDIIVTAATAGLRMGFTVGELTDAWNEVQRSNMTKTVVPTVIDGKLQKGNYYTPPNIAKVLQP